VSLLNDVVFSTGYYSSPSDDIHDDAIFPIAAAISDFNSFNCIPDFWHPCCVGGPVVAFIPAVACNPVVMSDHYIAVILSVACCWCYCCCLRHCSCLHPNCDKHSCCCWRPFRSCWVTVAGLPAIAGVPGVASISAFPFKLAVAGGPAVVGFPAVDGILAVDSIPADPVIPILAGVLIYWTV